MQDKFNLLFNIVSKSLNQFNLEVFNKTNDLVSFSDKNMNYLILYQIDFNSDKPRLYWKLTFTDYISHLFISEFSFKFDSELEYCKNKTKRVLNDLENIQRFKLFVGKIFKSVYKGDKDE